MSSRCSPCCNLSPSARYALQLTVSPDARHDISSFHAKRFPPVRPQFVTFFEGNAFLGKRHRERERFGDGGPCWLGGREGRGNGAHVAAMPSFLPLLAPHSAASEGEVVGARKRRSRDEQFILYLISSDRSRRRRRTRLVSACLPARVRARYG